MREAVRPPPIPQSDPRGLRPESRVGMTLMQFILAAAAIGGAGFSVGSLYPRIFAVETTVAKMQPSLERTVIQVERLAAVVDRIEKEKQ